MRERKRLEDALLTDSDLARRTGDISAYFELAREGESVDEELKRELDSLRETVERLETETLLSGDTDRNNAIDQYLEDWLSPAEAQLWAGHFDQVPPPMDPARKRAWMATRSGVSLGSDAFFPFRDNIDRAQASGVSYVAQPGGSVRDDVVIQACDDYGMVMCFTGTRLFHH